MANKFKQLFVTDTIYNRYNLFLPQTNHVNVQISGKKKKNFFFGKSKTKVIEEKYSAESTRCLQLIAAKFKAGDLHMTDHRWYQCFLV